MAVVTAEVKARIWLFGAVVLLSVGGIRRLSILSADVYKRCYDAHWLLGIMWKSKERDLGA